MKLNKLDPFRSVLSYKIIKCEYNNYIIMKLSGERSKAWFCSRGCEHRKSISCVCWSVYNGIS